MTTKPKDYPTPEEALREIGALRRKIGRQAMNDRLFSVLSEAGAARRRAGRYAMAEAKLQRLEEQARRVGVHTSSLADGRRIRVLAASTESDPRGHRSTAACAYRYEDESASPPWEGTRPWLERDEALALLAEEPDENPPRVSPEGYLVAALQEIREYVAPITPGTDWGDEVVRIADAAIARAEETE